MYPLYGLYTLTRGAGAGQGGRGGRGAGGAEQGGAEPARGLHLEGGERPWVCKHGVSLCGAGEGLLC
eukprot:5738508-Pyramimonas_sp.AAC.1